MARKPAGKPHVPAPAKAKKKGRSNPLIDALKRRRASGGQAEAEGQAAPSAPRGAPGSQLGRPKGSKNRISSLVKDALARSFEEVGSHEYLVTLAWDHPQAYAKLLGLLVPKETQVSLGRSLEEILDGEDDDDEEDGG